MGCEAEVPCCAQFCVCVCACVPGMLSLCILEKCEFIKLLCPLTPSLTQRDRVVCTFSRGPAAEIQKNAISESFPWFNGSFVVRVLRRTERTRAGCFVRRSPAHQSPYAPPPLALPPPFNVSRSGARGGQMSGRFCDGIRTFCVARF